MWFDEITQIRRPVAWVLFVDRGEFGVVIAALIRWQRF
jgi:hypothetical protein